MARKPLAQRNQLNVGASRLTYFHPVSPAHPNKQIPPLSPHTLTQHTNCIYFYNSQSDPSLIFLTCISHPSVDPTSAQCHVDKVAPPPRHAARHADAKAQDGQVEECAAGDPRQL